MFSSVGLEFSTNQGRSWSLLHTECLPELCAGPHLPHSTVYSSENYSGYERSPVRQSVFSSGLTASSLMISTHNIAYRCRWTRISIPLPNAALTETTRFRWKQSGSGAGSMWAVDNGEAYDTLSGGLGILGFVCVILQCVRSTRVSSREMTLKDVGVVFQEKGKIKFLCPCGASAVYIGPACLRFCSGRGHCSRTGCKYESNLLLNQINPESLGGKMSRLIIILMPRSTNHHSKLIHLYYGHHLLMDFHYLCLLFLLFTPFTFFSLSLSLSVPPPLAPLFPLLAGATQASAVRPASWPRRPSRRSSPRVSPVLASPPTTASCRCAALRSASAAASWPAARRWSSTGTAGGTWSRRRWTVPRPGSPNNISHLPKKKLFWLQSVATVEDLLAAESSSSVVRT